MAQERVSDLALTRIMNKIHEDDLTKSNWAPPLQAAPGAISAIGTCFVAASLQGASAVELSNPNEGADNSIVKLPYQYLDTNLQHCAHLGRAAFNVAESSMQSVFYGAECIQGPDGIITQIVRLVEDPEAARWHLRSNMEMLQESASDCKTQAEKIKVKFDHLLSFTTALSNATSARKNLTREQQAKNEALTQSSEIERQIYEKEQGVLEGLVDKQQKELETAEESLKEAQEGVNQRVRRDESPKTSIPDIVMLVDRNNPTPKQESLGAFREVGQFFCGKSDKTRKQEEKQDKQTRDRRDKQTKELLEQRQQEIKAGNEASLNKLHGAQAVAKQRQDALEATQLRYQKNVDKHMSRSKSLEIAKAQLRQLLREKGDLTMVAKVVQGSLEALAEMNTKINALLVFFQKVEIRVSSLLKGRLKHFLDTIENSVQASGNAKGAKIIENFEVFQSMKKPLIEEALELEGAFSVICDIANMYVTVSERFIRPGLDKMALLTVGRDAGSSRRSDEFDAWIADAEDQIGTLAITERRKMSARMELNVRVLKVEGGKGSAERDADENTTRAETE